jgi:hypothetical protein
MWGVEGKYNIVIAAVAPNTQENLALVGLDYSQLANSAENAFNMVNRIWN